MTDFILNSINECRWNFFDKLSQKATNISGPLGILSEYIHLLLPIVASGCLYHTLSRPNRIFRLAYIITSTTLIVIINRIDDISKKNWVKKQIKKICLESKPDEKIRKLVYIASSVSDPKGLFPSFFFDFKTKSDITHLAKNFDVNFIEAKCEEQLQNKISKLKDRDIDAVIIQAHGCRSIIQFSRDYQIKQDSLGIFETLETKLKANAKVSLISCSTGQGDENIAQKISILCSNATIFSPNADYKISDCDSFKISDDGSCYFKNGNFITGLFENRKNITKIYHNGESMQPV